MSKINIPIPLPQTSAISYDISYARIDNTTNPIYTKITGVTGTLYIIQNIDNGQYSIGLKANYADGRSCDTVYRSTSACSGVSYFNSALSSDGSQFNVNYTATSSSVLLQITYPNGGSFSKIYTNTGEQINIPVPANVYGDFSFTITPVCDIDTQFYGTPTSNVIVTVPQATGSVIASVSNSFGSGAGQVTGIFGITGFALSTTPLIKGAAQSGTHTALVNGTITVTVSGTTTSDAITMQVNGTAVISSQPVYGNASNTYTFTGISLNAGDNVVIYFNQSACCASGWTLSDDKTYCYKIDQVAATPSGTGSPLLTVQHFNFTSYGNYGVVFYKQNGYNVNGTWDITNSALYPNIYTQNSPSVYPKANVISYTSGIWINPSGDTVSGRLNVTGLWLQGNQNYVGTLGFSRQINIQQTGWYFIGVGSDNYGTITIDGTVIIQQDIALMSGSNYLNSGSQDIGFKFWHMYPVYLTAGYHIFGLQVTNVGAQGILGFEIYSGTENQLIALSSLTSSNLIFSTKDITNGSASDIGNYNCDAYSGYSLVNDNGTYYCRKIETTGTVAC